MKGSNFDASYVIGLPRMGRLAEFYTEFPSDWPMPVPHIFNAIDAQRVPVPNWWTDLPAMYGCTESHRAVIAQALSAGHKQIVIFEDDCRFVPDSVGILRDFLSQVPEGWDGLMFGGQVSITDGKTAPITDRVSKCVQVERLHAYALSLSGMRKFYEILSEPSSVPNDYRWGDAQEDGRLTVFRIEPFICFQREGRSSISDRIEPNRIWDERVDVRIRKPEDIPVIALVCPFDVMERLRDRGIISNGGESPPYMAVLAPGAVERTELRVSNTMLHVFEDCPDNAINTVNGLRGDAAYHKSGPLALWHPTEFIPYPGAVRVEAYSYEEAEAKLVHPDCSRGLAGAAHAGF